MDDVLYFLCLMAMKIQLKLLSVIPSLHEVLNLYKIIKRPFTLERIFSNQYPYMVYGTSGATLSVIDRHCAQVSHKNAATAELLIERLCLNFKLYRLVSDTLF